MTKRGKRGKHIWYNKDIIYWVHSYLLMNFYSRKSLNISSMADSSQFSPLNALSDQLGPNSSVSSVFIPAFIANIGKYFFLKYDRQSFKSI